MSWTDERIQMLKTMWEGGQTASQIAEALPGIVAGFTITVVAMIGASAMAGAVGAGGLGDVAIRYGYQRFDTTVMVVVIAILIALVCVVQFAGDTAVRRLRAR